VLLIYLPVTVVASMVFLVLASLLPLRFRISPLNIARLLSCLSFLWHLLLVAVSCYVVHQTATGVDVELLPFVLVAFGPGGLVAVIRIVLAGRDVYRYRFSATE
jgi:hypothetical protein